MSFAVATEAALQALTPLESTEQDERLSPATAIAMMIGIQIISPFKSIANVGALFAKLYLFNDTSSPFRSRP
ncbi:hypothetical protein, partial [Akkermansia muciniphila]|uniref:hypothetical protein n=1 Tax=Akkermansia muciniphila TaxID=239935 RepID=UPI003C7985B7